MIEPLQQPSISRQCEMLGIRRSSYYYRTKPIKLDDLELMRQIDEMYLQDPSLGSRSISRQLKRQGRKVTSVLIPKCSTAPKGTPLPVSISRSNHPKRRQAGSPSNASNVWQMSSRPTCTRAPASPSPELWTNRFGRLRRAIPGDPINCWPIQSSLSKQISVVSKTVKPPMTCRSDPIQSLTKENHEWRKLMTAKELQKRNNKAEQLRVLQTEDGQFFVESEQGKVLYAMFWLVKRML